MKQIEETKNLLKSLVKSNWIRYLYLLYLKQFNAYDLKLTYEKDDKLYNE